MRTFFKLNRSIYIFTSELFGVVAFLPVVCTLFSFAQIEFALLTFSRFGGWGEREESTKQEHKKYMKMQMNHS